MNFLRKLTEWRKQKPRILGKKVKHRLFCTEISAVAYWVITYRELFVCGAE
jgi:hypothetical protein